MSADANAHVFDEARLLEKLRVPVGKLGPGSQREE